jgi:general secretion pathway protein G
MRRGGGFTIIELLVTVALVSLMASIAVPAGEILVQRARERALREALREIRTALDAYKHAGEQGHIAMAPGDSGYPHKLTDLLGVRDQKDPNGAQIRFLRKIPRNPMCPDDTTAPEGTWGLRSYASDPANPRPGRDVFDVYPPGEGKGINGIPYKNW